MKLMSKFQQLYVVPVLLGVSVLAGCATSKPEPEPPAEDIYAQQMAEAEALASGGKQDAAVLLYEKVAAANPAKGEPWAKVAQIQFSQGHYSQAIVAAEETLKRDPSSREAKSVNAVGGLRLAVRSLEELRTDSALAGDAKSDATKLAQLLRETLGEPVLTPVEKPEVKPPVRRASRPAAARPKPAAPPPQRSANPFGALQ